MKEMIIELWSLKKLISIIIEDKKSPIIYSNQTNGYACSNPSTNGYLVPIEFDDNITKKFLNYEYAGNGHELGKSFYNDAQEIMEQLKDYFCDFYDFELDKCKLNDNTEAWVYLIAKKIKFENYDDVSIIWGFPNTFTAVLTWPNSD